MLYHNRGTDSMGRKGDGDKLSVAPLGFRERLKLPWGHVGKPLRVCARAEGGAAGFSGELKENEPDARVEEGLAHGANPGGSGGV